ncbi:MAG: hypothetical protein DRP22_05365 [Verrucomicrobia bacterium]|nr:MAG: hypothetical protein DRP22_05365 [Verrucomicrobiota bacterium]
MNGLVTLLLKDVRELLNACRGVRRHSVLKLGFIVAFMLAFTIGLAALFLDGFHFLDTLGGIGLLVVNRLFALFFFGLSCMLVLSALLASHTAFFRSPETDLLLTLPVPRQTVYLHRFFHAAALSSWAFFFIILPFVGAYAWHENLSWMFSFWTLLFAVPLVIFCAALGALLALIGAVIFPGRRLRALLLTGGLLAGAVWLWNYFRPALQVDSEATVFLSRLIPGLRLASYPLLPSWWISEGIMSLTRGVFRRGMLFWLVLFSNALMAVQVYLWVAGRLFVAGYYRVRGSPGVQRRRALLLSSAERILAVVLPRDIASLMVKDIRIFLRDPAQWGQSVFFFGLLALYFLNLRNLHYHTLPIRFRNLIVFLNVFSIATVMASFASRFIFPQLSLEGQSFWVIGMAPTTFGRVLIAKFTLAAGAAVTLAVLLMAVCVRMLGVEPLAARASMAAAASSGLALAALATGLGAVFMDLRRSDPTAIVSGFGGTVTLLVCLGYIALALLPLGLVFHIYGARGTVLLEAALRRALAWLVLLTAVATAVPLNLGWRALKRREY